MKGTALFAHDLTKTCNQGLTAGGYDYIVCKKNCKHKSKNSKT